MNVKVAQNSHYGCLRNRAHRGWTGAGLASAGPGRNAGRREAAAIAAAELVHRDIKHVSIMLSGGQAMVLDFGIAWAEGATAVTGTLAVLGTAACLSPGAGLWPTGRPAR